MTFDEWYDQQWVLAERGKNAKRAWDYQQKIIDEKDKLLQEAREILLELGNQTHTNERLFHWYCKNKENEQ